MKKRLIIFAVIVLVLNFANYSYAENINPVDYLPQNTYGSGNDSLYYTFKQNINGDYELVTTDKENTQLTIKYDNATKAERYNNGSETTINKTFINISPVALFHYRRSVVIDNVNSIFASNSSTSQGGAIYANAASISNVDSTFVGNNATSYYGFGGAIEYLKNANFENIKGDFIGNSGIGSGYAGGAAIYLRQVAGNSITGSFIGNYIKAPIAQGGAIGGNVGSNPNINILSGNFISNYAVGNSNTVRGGAFADVKINDCIYNSSFIGNYVKNNSTQIYLI